MRMEYRRDDCIVVNMTYYFMLFTDCLAYSKLTNGTHKLKHVLPLYQMRLHDLEDTPASSFSWKIVSTNKVSNGHIMLESMANIYRLDSLKLVSFMFASFSQLSSKHHQWSKRGCGLMISRKPSTKPVLLKISLASWVCHLEQYVYTCVCVWIYSELLHIGFRSWNMSWRAKMLDLQIWNTARAHSQHQFVIVSPNTNTNTNWHLIVRPLCRKDYLISL